MAVNELQFNVDDLQSQAEKIRSISDNLNDAKIRLSENLDLLRSDWVSSASDTFFSMYDTTWVTHIDQYCQWLNELSDALRYAASQYEPLVDEHCRIEFA